MEAHMQVRYPVFNGDDHELWSIKMRTLLMARDLWDMVESGVSEEENTNQSMEESAKRKKDLRIKDMTALHMLQMSVTDSVFLRIARAASSKQAWELLKADFGETEEFKRRKRWDLEGEYNQMVMKNEERFHEFIKKFMEVVNRAKFYGLDISDRDLIRRIFRNLPPRFNHAKININCENNTLREVLDILRELEDVFKEAEEASHNHVTSECYSKNKRGRH